MKSIDQRLLLEATHKKLKNTAEFDSKILSEMNNGLNWILTLTTILFVFFQGKHLDNSDCFNSIISFFSKLFFIVLVILLIVHKIVLIKYEKTKAKFLNTLETHYMELSFSASSILNAHIDLTNFSITEFINKFRDGEFLPSYDRKRFSGFDKSIDCLGKILSYTFWAGIIIFCLYFLVLIILLLK